MEEIKGGLPDKYSNKNFWVGSILMLIIFFFACILLCRVGAGSLEIFVVTGIVYLYILCVGLRFSASYVINEMGITITYINFKTWTVHFNWDEYYEIEFETPRRNDAGIDFVMIFKKKRKRLSEFIFSGMVGCECTEETYALVKSWIPDSVRMPKVKF